YRQVLRRAPAPVGDLERPRQRPAVRAKVGGPEPHRRDLAAARPASEGRTTTTLGVEPGRRRHRYFEGSSAPIGTPVCLALLQYLPQSQVDPPFVTGVSTVSQPRLSKHF